MAVCVPGITRIEAGASGKGVVLLIGSYPITGTLVHVDFAPTDYYVLEPHVLVTVWGGVTEVSITPVLTAVPGEGALYTGLDLTFPAGLVGKRFSVLVHGR